MKVMIDERVVRAKPGTAGMRTLDRSTVHAYTWRAILARLTAPLA
jgi:hypothetical protein